LILTDVTRTDDGLKLRERGNLDSAIRLPAVQETAGKTAELAADAGLSAREMRSAETLPGRGGR
jgi:hypothetical protein